jgi:hypothetical protein
VDATSAGPRPLCVWWHGSPSWSLPGASLLHFLHKNLYIFFWNFSRNFIFEGFSEIGKSIKAQKNEDETISSKSKPSMQQL